MQRGNQRMAAPSRHHHSIKEWPEEDRPREKLLRHGPATLSEAELLAVLFRSGKRGATALDLAKGVLAAMGPLQDLARLTVSDFVNAGLGAVRAATLVAVFELARRIPSGDGTVRPFFRSPEDVSAQRSEPRGVLGSSAHVCESVDSRGAGDKRDVEFVPRSSAGMFFRSDQA